MRPTSRKLVVSSTLGLFLLAASTSQAALPYSRGSSRAVRGGWVRVAPTVPNGGSLDRALEPSLAGRLAFAKDNDRGKTNVRDKDEGRDKAHHPDKDHDKEPGRDADRDHDRGRDHDDDRDHDRDRHHDGDRHHDHDHDHDGDRDDDHHHAPRHHIAGTASLGAPIVGAAVTLKDSLGAVRAATTDAGGHYTIDTTGLTPPFFIRVVTSTASGAFPAGTTLYSVSADALLDTIINADVLTNLIVRTWFGTEGVNPDSAFGDPLTNPAPTPLAVQLITWPVLQALQLWFNAAGLVVVPGAPADPSQLNLFSSAFVADNTGIDAILHLTTQAVDPVSGVVTALTITSADGQTTQTSAFVYTTATNSFSITSTTTSGSNLSSGVISAVAPTADEQAALLALSGPLTAFKAKVNGGPLSASDFLPILAPDFLDDGNDAAEYAAQAANDLSGATINDVHILAIDSIDLAAGLADVLYTVNVSGGGQTQDFIGEWNLEDVGGTWLIRGNQRIAQARLIVETRTFQSNGAPSTSGNDVWAGVTAPERPTGTPTVGGARVTGGTNAVPPALGSNIFSSTPIPANAKRTQAGVTYDQWGVLSAPLPASPPIPAGTPFRFDIHPAGSPPGTIVSYTVPSNVFTNETISVLTPLPGNGVLANILGQTITVNWSALPTTFVVAGVFLNVEVYDGLPEDPATHSCSSGGQLLPTATSGQLTVPATLTCDANQPVQHANIFVEVNGTNGEDALAQVWYF